MDLRSASINADILNFISDGNLHTINEIASQVEISRSTVKRHLQSLSYRYPIETFKGGVNFGGVILNKQYIYQGKIRSKDELQIIEKALRLLQESDCNVDKETLGKLIKEYSLPTKEQE